ncbi:MAG: hypothetical protein ACLFWH_15585 [Actinomycetota bacterium]
MGIAAVVIDATGAGFNERRQDQIGADVASMAGIIDFASGKVAVRDQVMDFVARNVDGPADWQTAWETCTDPNRNDGGFSFESVDDDIECISMDPAGYVRVRVPDQFVETTFGNVIGFDSLTTSAAAIARTVTHAQGGILPFAVVGGGNVHYCMRSDTGGGGGGAPDPCDGPDTGNFGTIDSPLFGDPVLETSEHCSNTAQFRILATNIALGLDHPVEKNTNYPGGTITDDCGNFGINSLYTDQGMGNGTEEGLINGTASDFHSPLAEPLLQQSHATRNVAGVQLNNKPLWEHLLPDGTGRDFNDDGDPDSPVQYNGTSPNAPADCDPATFDGGDQDWDGDGSDEPNRSWIHMKACLEQYVAGSYSGQMFAGGGEIFDGGGSAGVESLSDNSRFGYVPQFHEPDFPSGGSAPRNIDVFRAVFIQGVWFDSGAGQRDFHPGEDPTETYSGNFRQVSGFLMPEAALPGELRGDPLPSGESTNRVSLYR